jgi:hypothetical protein
MLLKLQLGLYPGVSVVRVSALLLGRLAAQATNDALSE